VHWLATITLDDAAGRDPLIKHLDGQGIDARQMIFPVHEAIHFRDSFDASEFPVSTSVSHRSLHLPSGTELKDDEIDHISDVVLQWLAKNE
jgi:dTDP-4-amino-4,6-dideoxygalactose transaminase